MRDDEAHVRSGLDDCRATSALVALVVGFGGRDRLAMA
jgi:hypothetical protein